jgi:soluble lytic murein transglycosylase
MSPPTAMATRRTAASPATARRLRVARRRRRSVLGVAAAILALVIATIVLPLAKRVVNDLSLPLSYQDVIREQAAAKHLDPALIAAIIYAETKFDPRTSSAGAEGLMQILPQTALFLAHRSGATTFHVSDLGTPQVNIAYGSYYLRYLLDEYHGSKLLAVAAYNGGEANVNQWVARARSDGARFTVGGIPFPETRAYVQRVLQAQHDYRATYPTQLGYR